MREDCREGGMPAGCLSQAFGWKASWGERGHMTPEDLRAFAREIRRVSCEMMLACGNGHIGGSLSIADAMAALFGNHIRPGELEARKDGARDWFVLSKGHAGPAYYAVLMLLGKLGREHVGTLNQNGTLLPSHPDRMLTPGVEVTTGSLGQGIAQAAGLAFGLAVQGLPGRVYCVIGDGEFQEGETFEALQFAAGKRLDKLIVLIDCNKKQVDGLISEVCCPTDFKGVLEGLGIRTLGVDGGDVAAIDAALTSAEMDLGSCHAILLDTVKGAGVTHFSKMPNPHHLTFDEQDRAALRAYIEEDSQGVDGLDTMDGEVIA